ncbi:MAG: hypothetical protein ACREFE_03910 [Limisphaerales bacterium]
MSVETLSEMPPDISSPVAVGLARSVVRHLRAEIDDWYDACRRVTVWEDDNLLEDNPAPEKMAEHATMIDELERIGKWFSLATQSPDFPDADTAELVRLTLQDLKDRRAMWHGKKMSREESDKILTACGLL